MKTIPKRIRFRYSLALFAVATSICSDPVEAEETTEETNVTVTVRQAPCLIGGAVRGSMQQIKGENVTVTGGFSMSGDLMVPGTPTLILRGKPSFAGTLTGNGSTSPSGYKVALNGNCSLRYLRTRTAPVAMSAVSAPPQPRGKRIVCINGRPGSFSDDRRDELELRDAKPCGEATTMRDLILGNHAGLIAVPPGTYGTFIVNSGAGLELGVTGGIEPVKYDLQHLILIGRATVKIVGPVILTVAHGLLVNGPVGAPDHPEWLQLRLADGGLMLADGAVVYGQVLAPDGTVLMICDSKLVGTLACDQLILGGKGRIWWSGSVDPPAQRPVATSQSVTLAENTPTTISLTASDPQARPLTYTVLTQPEHGTLSGAPPNLTFLPANNYFGGDTFTFKVNNGITDSLPATVSLTVTQIFFPPVAIAQQLTNVENTLLPVILTGYDPQGFDLDFTVLTPPKHGALTGTAPQLSYQPNTNYYGTDSFSFKVNDGVTDSAAALIGITIMPVDYPPIVSAGLDQLIIWSTNVVQLAGSVFYFPFPATVNSVLWRQVAGPGVVTFSDPSNIVTSATFDQPGLYQLELFASDSFLAGSDSLLVTVDEPPMVQAGTAITNTFPGTLELSGTVSDDGLPANGSMTVFWEKLSGPGDVVFENPSATNSLVTFGTNGIYQLRLTADDGIATNSEIITIIENEPPTVSVSANESIVQLPGTVSLTGIASDDGFPGETLAYNWSQISGPGTVVFSHPDQINTSASFSELGVYALRFAADDSAATGHSEVNITVLAANHPPEALSQSLTTEANVPLEVLLDGTDNDGDSIAFSVVSQPAHGTLSGAPPNLLYEPEPDYLGQDSFEFLANDGQTSSEPATVVININPTIIGPKISVPRTQVVTENKVLTFNYASTISITDENPDLDLMELSLSVSNGSLTLNYTYELVFVSGSNGSSNLVVRGSLHDLNNALESLAYAGVTNFFGTDLLVATVDDLGFNGIGNHRTDSQSLTIKVRPILAFSPSATAGTNFWVCRLPAYSVTRMRWILLLAEEDTTVTVTAPDRRPQFYDDGSFSTAPGGITVLDLKAGEPHMDWLEKLNYYSPVMASDEIANTAFEISSSSPISLLVDDFSFNDSEAFRPLPTTTLGTNYIIASYSNFQRFPRDVFGSQFSVTAVESNTVVTIIPTVTTSGHAAGQPYSVILQRGGTYTLRHTETATGDLTGSSVISDKPVAVLAGNAFTGIPAIQGYYVSGVAEQLMPVEHWDTEYVVAQLAGQASYVVRILAAYDGTTVNLPGLGETNLNRGQFLELIPTNDLQVIASQPVAVCQYTRGDPSADLPGTPNQFWVPGVHQGLTDSEWVPPEVVQTLNFGPIMSIARLYTNFVNLVVASTAVNDLMINGDSVPPEASISLVGDGRYTKVTFEVNNDLYQVHCSAPVVTVNYGFLADFDSYGPGSYGLAGPFSLPTFPLDVAISIATPTNGSRLIAGTPNLIAANLADPESLVTNIQFLVNGSKLLEGAVTNFIWTPEQDGNFPLQMVANALTGQSVTSAPIEVAVSFDLMSGGVLISSPFDGAPVYVNGLTLIILDFKDPLGAFDHAEFFANDINLGGTTNDTFYWIPPETNDFVLSAIVYDLLGNAYPSSNTVTVHAIPPPRPVLAITTPTNGSRIRAGFEASVIASLFDPAQITTNLQFFVDRVKVSDDAAYFSWTPTLVGNHSLQAVALTSGGDRIESATVNVTVAEMFAPAVHFLAPSNYQTFASGNVPVLTVEASDSDGWITNLVLRLDNSVFAVSNVGVLAVSAGNLTPGWHETFAEASDNDGLTSSSEIIRFFAERSEIETLPRPQQLVAVTLSSSAIQLSWESFASDPTVQKILIQRWDAANLNWVELAEIPAANTNYPDPKLDPETNYRYRLACLDANGNRSAFSLETNATTRTVVPNYGTIDLSTVVAVSLTNLVPGGNSLSNGSLAQFDLRRTAPLGTLHAQSTLGTSADTVRQAAARFTEHWPQIQLDFNPILLSPHSILPRVGYLTGPDGSGITVSPATAQMFDSTDPGQPVKAFLQEHRDLFGFGPEEITNAFVQRDYVTPATGARTIVWQQQVAGIPAFNSLFIGHLTAQRELAALACDFIPAPAQAADPNVVSAVFNSYSLPVSGTQALQAAVNNAGDVFSASDITSQSAMQGITRSQSYVASKALKGIAHAALTWFPASRNKLKLAWQIIFTSPWRNEMYLTLVSAENGEILYRRNLTADNSEASYRVFTDSSPEPLLPGWPTPDNTQPPWANRALVTLTALDTNASPNGWINDGDNETSGNNVDARLDRNDNDFPNLPRPKGDPGRVFDFGLDLGTDPLNYGEASVVQLFYWDNWVHDVLYGLGFTEAAGNFQTDNFGRGGYGADALLADAQNGLNFGDSKHRNNASMSTPPDGYAPLMQADVFEGAIPNRDASLDAGLIVHEYTHGLTSRLIGGGAGIDARQTIGMGEGWSDFFSLALLANPAADPDAVYPVGSYVAYHSFGTTFDENYYFGIRHYPYCTDLNKNPLTYADIDPGQANIHAGVPCSPLTGPLDPAIAGEPHGTGEVWCMMLWELRANLIHKLGGEAGNRLALQLVTDGLRFSPPNPNFVQARDAILLADRMISNDADAPEIWAAFTKRGLGYAATAPDSYTVGGVQESFSPTPDLVVEQVIIQGGDESGKIGTNTDNQLLVVIHNQGSAVATQVSAQITTSTPGVQILQSDSNFEDIPQGESRGNQVLLQLETLPEFVAGTPIDLTVTINAIPRSVTTHQRLYTGTSGPSLPANGDSSATPTSGSAVPPDLTPWDLGNLEPLWMADDASCLLKAGPGKYILWRPGLDPIPMTNPNFLAHRLTHQGVVVGELATDIVIDFFGDIFTNTVGAKWIPGDPAPTPLTTGLYAYPKGSSPGQNVGLVYDVDPILSQLNYLGGVGEYPRLHSIWDMNASGQSAGAASVYLRPPDLNMDGYISTNEVRMTSLEQHLINANGEFEGFQRDERTLSANSSGVNSARQVYYNALLTSATRFLPDDSWNWLGPVNFSGGSVFSVGLLINDAGDVAGTGSTHTGNQQIDALEPTRVFRWSSIYGEFSSGGPHVFELGLLDGGEHAFPLVMNQAGDIVGYSDLAASTPGQNLTHAVFWPLITTTPQDLGALDMVQGNSQALSVNENRQIVGVSQKSDGNPSAVLWQFNHCTNNPEGTGFWEITDLNDLSAGGIWHVDYAVDIDNESLILASATTPTGERHAVLLTTAQMAVDNDRDGEIRFDDSDETSTSQPYRFWLNDDQDESLSDWKWTESDPEIYESSPKHQDLGDQIINSPRDCEDLTRLWLNPGNFLKFVSDESTDFYLGLKWGNLGGSSPAIRLFSSADTNGGLGHIKDATIAAKQANPSGIFKLCLLDADDAELDLVKHTERPADFIFRKDTFSDLGDTQSKLHLLFEGVSEGRGQLRLVILRKNHDGTWVDLGEFSSLWLDLKNIRRMYMRAYSTPLPEDFPLPWQKIASDPDAPIFPYEKAQDGSLVTPNANFGYGVGDSVEVASQFAFEPAPDEQKKCVVFVHGIDLDVPSQQGYAQTFFKRLWWEGYRGRFAAFRWSTTLLDGAGFLKPFADKENTSIYNSGEYRSWKGGTSLNKYVAALRANLGNDEIISVAGHSLGNACVGEALRQGMKVDGYVAMEAAVPLSCYYKDFDRTPNNPELVRAEIAHPTPQNAGELGYQGFLRDIYKNAGARVSYYNQLDFWLVTGTVNPGVEAAMKIVIDTDLHWPLSDSISSSIYNQIKNVDWITNQKLRKPDDRFGFGQYVYGSSAWFFRGGFQRPVSDPHEAMAFVARSQTRPLGAGPQPPNFNGLDIKVLFKFDGERSCHSGQFQRDIQLMYGNYNGNAWLDEYGREITFYRGLMKDLQVNP